MIEQKLRFSPDNKDFTLPSVNTSFVSAVRAHVSERKERRPRAQDMFIHHPKTHLFRGTLRLILRATAHGNAAASVFQTGSRAGEAYRLRPDGYPIREEEADNGHRRVAHIAFSTSTFYFHDPLRVLLRTASRLIFVLMANLLFDAVGQCNVGFCLLLPNL